MLSLWTGTLHLWKPLAAPPTKGPGRQRRPSSGTKPLSRSTHPVRNGRLGWRSTFEVVPSFLNNRERAEEPGMGGKAEVERDLSHYTPRLATRLTPGKC